MGSSWSVSGAEPRRILAGAALGEDGAEIGDRGGHDEQVGVGEVIVQEGLEIGGGGESEDADGVGLGLPGCRAQEERDPQPRLAAASAIAQPTRPLERLPR